MYHFDRSLINNDHTKPPVLNEIRFILSPNFNSRFSKIKDKHNSICKIIDDKSRLYDLIGYHQYVQDFRGHLYWKRLYELDMHGLVPINYQYHQLFTVLNQQKIRIFDKITYNLLVKKFGRDVAVIILNYRFRSDRSYNATVPCRKPTHTI